MCSKKEKEDDASLFELCRALDSKFDCADGGVVQQDDCKYKKPSQNNVKYFLKLSHSTKSKEERKEIHSLLAEAALTDSKILEAIIRYYFRNLNSQQDNLCDLKSIINGLIAQVDYYDYVFAVYEMVCFTHRTGNAQLSQHVWSKYFSTGNSNDRHMESILECLDEPHCHLEVLHKAIGFSPLATEQFYKFIEDSMSRRYSDVFSYAFYQLTMAQREPSLANEQKLQSFLSIFKRMDVECLFLAAKAIFHHNESYDAAHQFSPRITSALMECLPTEDHLASLLHRDTPDFGHIMYCYVKLGTIASHLKLIEMFKEALLDEGFEAPAYENREVSERLLCVWLTYLEMQLTNDNEPNRQIAAFQLLQCFMIYCDSGDMDDSDIEDLSSVMDELSLEMLENTLIGLYERERNRASSGGCLKGTSPFWYICQSLCDTLASHKDLFNGMVEDFEPEHIVKLMCCIFWSEAEDAIEKYVKHMTRLPFEKVRYCLSLFIVSSEEIQKCATCSPHTLSALQDLIFHCIKQLFVDAEGSWSRTNVCSTNVDRPRKVLNFYKSEEKSKKFQQFKTYVDARHFGVSATKGLPWAHYKVNKERKTYSCKITKLYPTDFDDVLSKMTPPIGQTLNVFFSDTSTLFICATRNSIITSGFSSSSDLCRFCFDSSSRAVSQ